MIQKKRDLKGSSPNSVLQWTEEEKNITSENLRLTQVIHPWNQENKTSYSGQLETWARQVTVAMKSLIFFLTDIHNLSDGKEWMKSPVLLFNNAEDKDTSSPSIGLVLEESEVKYFQHR